MRRLSLAPDDEVIDKIHFSIPDEFGVKPKVVWVGVTRTNGVEKDAYFDVADYTITTTQADAQWTTDEQLWIIAITLVVVSLL